MPLPSETLDQAARALTEALDAFAAALEAGGPSGIDGGITRSLAAALANYDLLVDQKVIRSTGFSVGELSFKLEEEESLYRENDEITLNSIVELSEISYNLKDGVVTLQRLIDELKIITKTKYPAAFGAGIKLGVTTDDRVFIIFEAGAEVNGATRGVPLGVSRGVGFALEVSHAPTRVAAWKAQIEDAVNQALGPNASAAVKAAKVAEWAADIELKLLNTSRAQGTPIVLDYLLMEKRGEYMREQGSTGFFKIGDFRWEEAGGSVPGKVTLHNATAYFDSDTGKTHILDSITVQYPDSDVPISEVGGWATKNGQKIPSEDFKYIGRSPDSTVRTALGLPGAGLIDPQMARQGLLDYWAAGGIITIENRAQFDSLVPRLGDPALVRGYTGDTSQVEEGFEVYNRLDEDTAIQRVIVRHKNGKTTFYELEAKRRIVETAEGPYETWDRAARTSMVLAPGEPSFKIELALQDFQDVKSIEFNHDLASGGGYITGDVLGQGVQTYHYRSGSGDTFEVIIENANGGARPATIEERTAVRGLVKATDEYVGFVKRYNQLREELATADRAQGLPGKDLDGLTSSLNTQASKVASAFQDLAVTLKFRQGEIVAEDIPAPAVQPAISRDLYDILGQSTDRARHLSILGELETFGFNFADLFLSERDQLTRDLSRIATQRTVLVEADGSVSKEVAAKQGRLAELQAKARAATGLAEGDIPMLDSAGRPIIDPNTGKVAKAGTVTRAGSARVKTYTDGPLKGITRIDIGGAPLGIDFRDAGTILGNLLGKSLAGDNRLARAAVSGALKTVGGTLGSIANGLATGASREEINAVIASFGPELVRNLQLKGVGALSSFIVENVLNALGIDGFVGELLNTAGGEFLRSTAANLLGLANASVAFNVGAAVGAFLGSKAAGAIYSFKSVGGQIGSQIGSTIGSFLLPGFVGAFLGHFIGGAIGSIFGGTPRSGADVVWDEANGQFAVDNVYSKLGGSKELARDMAQAAANMFNGAILAVGGELLNPEAVQSGNYGMRGSTVVYRPVHTRDKDAITARFKGKDAPEKLINHGIYHGLSDPDFALAGGDVIIKRALYATIDGTSVGDFTQALLIGNLESARAYRSYLENAPIINALLGASQETRDSQFAAETALTLIRATELGLDRRHWSDWIGGFNWLLDAAQVSASTVRMRFEVDPASANLQRVIDLGYGPYNPRDQIDLAGQDRVLGTSGNDAISLVGNRVNGDPAQAIEIAATVDAGAGDDRIDASDRGDNIFGGAGNDVLYGGALDDWLFGGDGNDRLEAGDASGGLGGSGNYLAGGAGDDQLIGREGADWLAGGTGTDLLLGAAGGDILEGESGDGDVVEGGAGTDQYIFRRGDGRDTAFDAADTSRPGDPSSAISAQVQGINAGARARNWAGDGRFTVDGSVLGGEDAISFGAGITMSNIILSRPSAPQGGAGNDLIIRLADPATGAWNGRDELVVKDWFVDTRRVEWLRFANGEEIRIGDLTSFKIGTSANDVIIGTLGNDFLYGGDGNDKLFGLAGDDFGIGGKGDDFVAGDSDDDWVMGSEGKDVVVGGAGRDTAFGDDGDDDVYGGDGNDLVVGGRGTDWVVGGAGDDVFRYNRGDGRDTMFDAYVSAWAKVRVNGVYQPGFREEDGKIYRDAQLIFDGQSWLGRFDYDDATNTLSYLVPPADGSVAASAGADTLEFGVGVDIDDIQLRRSGGDLELAVTRNGGAESFDSVADKIIVKEWFSTGATIETFQFVETGGHNVAAMTLAGGTDGADTLTGSVSQANWLTGNAGDDAVIGGAADDILNGNAGRDHLRGGDGSDVLYGGAGDDRLEGGGGQIIYDPEFGTSVDNRRPDLLVGGSGTDVAVYEASSNAYLSNSAANTGEAYRDGYVGIEGIEGGAGSDRLGGDEGDNLLAGGGGNDLLMAGAGDDVYLVNASGGADVIREGALTVEEVLDEAGRPNTALYNFTWTSLGERKVNGREFRDCYQLTITRKGSGEIVYQSRETVDFTYKKKEAGKAIGDVSMPPAALWPAANGQWRIAFATGNGLQRVWERLSIAADGDASGRDVLEIGPNLSLSDLSFARSGADGADLVVQVGPSAANRVTIEKQAGGGRVETLQLDDGLSANLASLKINEAGGDGDDLVVGTAGADSLTGAAGHDVLSGGAGFDRLDGGSGDDVLEGGADGDTLIGDTDSVTTGAAPNGGAAFGDTIRYVRSGAAVSINLDTLVVSGGDATGDIISGIENVTGSEGFGDTLAGNDLANRLLGLGGDDALVGAGGDDVLVGGAGIDSIAGGDGADNINAGAGNDIDVRGGAGNDLVAGDAGDDVLHGDGGDDTLDGGTGADILHGGEGADVLGGGRDDASADLLYGGAGNDSLSGEAGDDRLHGGDGADMLLGGLGNDVLHGEAGDDTYLFDANAGADTIVEAGGGRNKITLTGVSHDRVWMTRSGNDLLISVFGGDTRITVAGAFADPTAPSIREIVTGDRSLFIKYGELEGLLGSMAAASSGVPAAMPAEVGAKLDAFWWVGGKATPRIDPVAVSGSVEDVAVTGRIVAVDHDESALSYTLVEGSGPTADQGLLTVNADGSWSFAPHANWFGTVSFRVKVIDADGLTAERAVSFDMAPANDAASAILVSDRKAGIAERDRPRRHSDMGRIELATLAIADVDGQAPVHLPHTYNKLSVLGDDRFEVVEGKLYLRAGVAFDFETVGSVPVTIRAEDESDASLFVDRVLTFDILDIVDLLEASAPGQALVGQEPRAGQGGADELIGYEGDNSIQGLGGDDIASGGAGNDLLDGGAGDDRLYGELGADQLLGGDGADQLLGGEDDDLLDGGAGDDRLQGGSGKDRLTGGAGDDVILGDEDDDIFLADAGADELRGGDGVDTVDYSASASAVTLTLSGAAATGDLADGDTLVEIEAVIGTALEDRLTGDAAENRLSGGLGDDTLAGMGGSDLLEGGLGRDRLLGGDGADVLRGGGDSDGDQWDGVGSGRVDAATAVRGLFGGAGKDLLEGDAGDDVLFGGDGNDILHGGSGNDRMDGGTGHDLYEVYRSSGHDRIYNWDPLGDDIDVVGYREEITRDMLWFRRDGDDLIVDVIGQDVSTRIVDWYKATSASERGNHRIDFFAAAGANGQPGWTTVKMNAQAMVDLMQGFATPSSLAEFEAMKQPGTAFGDQWAAAWQPNKTPVILGVADQIINEDGTLSVTLTLSDDVTPGDLVRFEVSAVDPDNYDQADVRIVDTLSFTRGAEAGQIIVTFKPKADADGRVAFKVTATDANDDNSVSHFAVTVRGVADAPTLRVDAETSGVFAPNGTRLGTLDTTGIALIIQPALTDTDGSEVIDAIYVAGLPDGLTLSAGSRQADGRWKLSEAELVGLKINPVLVPNGAPGWSQDLTGTHALQVTTVSREAGTNPAPAVATATSIVQRLDLVINTRPHALAAGAALAVDENRADRNLALGSFAGADADGDALTYAIVAGYDAGGRLNVRSDGTLELTGTGGFDHESEPTVGIRVRVTDTAGASFEKDFTFEVRNVNEGPSAIRQLTGTTFVTEADQNADRVVATFAVDDGDGSATSIRLLSQSGNVLRVVGNELRLRAGGVDFDTLAAGQALSDTDGDGLYEFVASATVRGADEQFETPNSITHNVRIEDVNEAPTLSGGGLVTVREDRPFDGIGNDRALVADLDASDPDMLSDPTYRDLSYVITGGNEAGYFEINPLTGQVYLKKPLNYDLQSSFHLTVEARDMAGVGLASNAVGLNIAVQDVNAPVLSTSRLRNRDQSAGSDLAQIAQDTFWVTAGRHAGNFIQISGYDQESGTNLHYQIEPDSMSVSESHFNSSGDDDYDGPAPVLYMDSTTGIVRFDQPDRPNKDVEHEWEGGINNRYPGGDQRKGRIQLVYRFTVRVTDGDGDYTKLPMTVTFVRRGSSFPPVVLDLDGDGVELVSLATSPVRFDVDDDGFVDQTGWVGADDGLLALDKDGSGAIDKADELSFAADLVGAESDLEGLRAYDSNADGRLDVGDADYGRFRIWQDANQDGVSQADELHGLADRGITSIDLALTKTGDRVTGSADNVIYATSSYALADGTTGTVGDVFLAFLPGVPEGAEQLPVEHTGVTDELVAAEAAEPDEPEEIDIPVIQGEDGDDVLAGTDYNDQFEGAGGNDTLLGGRGFDTAFYLGNVADYVIETRDGQMFVRGVSNAGLMDGTDALASIEQLVFADASIGYAAPIVLDLDGNGVKLKELGESTVRFDMVGGGKGQRTAWTKGGDAFLVLDRNENGLIDGIGEMSFLGDKENAKSDLDGLTTFDSDKSGAIDLADRRYSHFRLWRDANGDGKSDLGELVSLADAGVVSISLAGQAVNKKWKVGDAPILNTLSFTFADGRTGNGADVALAFSTASPEAEQAAKQAAKAQARISRPDLISANAPLSLADIIKEGDREGAPTGVTPPTQTKPAPANDAGSADLNKLIEQMAAFGGANDEVASADSLNWKRANDPLHFGLLTASGITK